MRRYHGGAGFGPTAIPGLAIWLDAKDFNTLTFSTGTDVSGWANKGAAGVGNAAQATANLQPLYVASAINGLPAVQFRDDGATKQLTIADSVGLDFTTMSAFVVAKRVTDLGAIEHMFGKFDTGASQREWRLVVNNNDNLQGITSQTGSGTVVDSIIAATTINVATPFIGDFYYNATNQLVSLNNGTPDSDPQAAVFNGTSVVGIGSINSGATQPYDGYIGEILFYNSVLTAAQRLQVLNYLSRKWGITIS